MRRSGFIIAGGIAAILRGISGGLVGFVSLASLFQIADVITPYAAILVFELFVSVGLIVFAIYALVKANNFPSVGTIRLGGFAIFAAGGLDGLLALIFFRDVAGVSASALGSLVALGIIGALFVIGAGRLSAAWFSANDEPTAV